MENDGDPRGIQQHRSLLIDNRGYALRGKIMLTSMVILFIVLILMVCLHLYARWYLVRARRRQLRLHRLNRRSHFVFYVDPTHPVSTVSSGLEAAVLESLPVFGYSSKTHAGYAMDCAVCLSEFEENESTRILPKCNHIFHIDCIDMWFHSHSTCPLCRSPVELVTGQTKVAVPPDDPVAVQVSVESEPGSRSEAESTEGGATVSQNQQQVLSIVSSFRRMLSREKKGSSTASVNDVEDVERGGRDGTHL